VVTRVRVRVDRDSCASSGNCADIAGAVFAQDDVTGVVILLDEHPDASALAAVHRAARLCPAQAIEVEVDVDVDVDAAVDGDPS
jgi:ferredoxin